MSQEVRPPRAADVPCEFTTTHWSVVLAAGGAPSPQADAALEELCRTYWYPLYAYVRSSGYSPANAEDLTQEFFARLLAKDYLAAVHPERGRFRWFLLCAVKRFLLNEQERDSAGKRGGTSRHVPFDGEKAEQRYRLDAADLNSPDRLFDRAWAANLIETTYQRIEEEYSLEGKKSLFLRLRTFLSGDKADLTYAELGAGLRMTEGAMKVAVHRLRRRYRDLLREQVAHTVHTPADLEEELRSLRAAFSG
ncbi:MAG TPA: sigma-70 family RNA polymerase sigma factor [Verrucomicrobiota bacterium]|nr:sigma-70 family RNA polymerase sigma factor [Verrucomicrobiota bacterium]HRZ37383.1 sigma-70 family RNA polymerase sigma factor [Candidatus Paceibacterota bacterium]HRZ56969.1 sigma-70 family RNA polymerase sigma factor [Candidatus Paceibacterota bacterium]